MSAATLVATDERAQTWRWFAFVLAVGAPLLLFLLLVTGVVHDPVWAVPEMHFYIVTLVSTVAVAMAIFMSVSALALRDIRVYFLSIAYLSSSVVLLVHALATPGVIVGPNPWVGFAGDFGIFLAGAFLALASANWTPAFQRRILRYGGRILWGLAAALVAFAAFAMFSSYAGFAGAFGFLVGDYFVVFGILLTYSVLLMALFRFIELYRHNPGPVLFSVLASNVLLLETVVSMSNSDLWLASWWLHHVLLVLAFLVVAAGIAWQFRRRSTLRGVLEGLLLRDSLNQVEREYTDAIIALIAAVEARDPYTHGHSANVAMLSEKIGRELGLRGEALETLHLSALLHDIGKIGISDSVLLKPGKLTEPEFSAIKEHPQRGVEIVERIGSLSACLPGIRWHHERLDGSGYPDGLAGDEIPLMARIIAVADSYDAMTSKRPYRGPMSRKQALAIIQGEAGTRLDEVVVAAFLDSLGEKASKRSVEPGRALAAD